ncbi:MAG: ribosome maturation factor RimM [Bacillota bacterium]
MIKLNDNYITIGQITRFQGNKGEVRVKPLTDIPERFFELEKVYLKNKENIIEMEIEYIRFHKQFVIIKFLSINSISDAEKYRNFEVLIPDAEKLILPEDYYYVDSLIDMEVYLKDGSYLGVIIDVIDTSGTDIFLIKGKIKEFMIPASKEMILDIDFEENKIIAEPVEGLLDL